MSNKDQYWAIFESLRTSYLGVVSQIPCMFYPQGQPIPDHVLRSALYNFLLHPAVQHKVKEFGTVYRRCLDDDYDPATI